MYGILLSVRLSDEEAAKLERLERMTHRTRSEIVRLLIDAAVASGIPDLKIEPGQFMSSLRK